MREVSPGQATVTLLLTYKRGYGPSEHEPLIDAAERIDIDLRPLNLAAIAEQLIASNARLWRKTA